MNKFSSIIILFFIVIIVGYFLYQLLYLLYTYFKKNHEDFKHLLVQPITHPLNKQIPYIIHMTYSDLNKIPQKVYDNIQKYAPEYQLKLYDNQTGLEFLKKHFSKKVQSAFQNAVLGAHKADLLRYCLLYIQGGVYLDVKTVFLKPFNEIFKDRNKSYFVFTNPIDKIYNGILATYPRNPFYLKLINDYINVSSETVAQNYLVFCQNFFKLLKNETDNPDHFQCGSTIEFPDFTGYFFQERCTQSPENCKLGGGLDKYGYCCHIYDKNNEPIFHSRYADFPW